ncbi:hypothetical protein ACET3Z_002608 [Daucus carota]
MERNEVEEQTGEAELMDEAMRNEELFTPPPTTPRRSQRIAQGSQTSSHEVNTSKSVFMPTPGMERTSPTAGTPMADNPRTSRKKSKGPVKSFTAPRKK